MALAARARQDQLVMLGKLLVIAVLMFGFGYALVPMYRAICDALGINVLSLGEQKVPGAVGATQRNTQVDLSRTVTIEFDANARGPWKFWPAQRSIQVHPGRLYETTFFAHNLTGRDTVAQAVPNIAPSKATPERSSFSRGSPPRNMPR